LLRYTYIACLVNQYKLFGTFVFVIFIVWTISYIVLHIWCFCYLCYVVNINSGHM
jgi:hypothetical protein